MGVVHFVLYALLGVGAGALIGCVGIGGVIVVPALVYLAGVPLPVAIAAAMFAFVVSGAVGLYGFARARSIDWPMAAWLCFGAAPAAFVGARLVAIVPAAAIEAAIGAVTAAAGVHALVRRDSARSERATPLRAPALAATGAATGLASALTGTGGPLLLLPALLWLDVPLLAALGSAQAIQVPIAAAATAGNVLAHTLDVPLGLTLGAGIALGTAAGAKAAHALPTAKLRGLVAALLVVVGLGILLRLAIHR